MENGQLRSELEAAQSSMAQLREELAAAHEGPMEWVSPAAAPEAEVCTGSAVVRRGGGARGGRCCSCGVGLKRGSGGGIVSLLRLARFWMARRV